MLAPPPPWQVLDRLQRATRPSECRELTMQLRRMCAGIRASLETHVRAEESELWPLFAEHFSVAEQQYLVGLVIGRTGAQVLQTLIPWVTGAAGRHGSKCCMRSLWVKFEPWSCFQSGIGTIQSRLFTFSESSAVF